MLISVCGTCVSWHMWAMHCGFLETNEQHGFLDRMTDLDKSTWYLSSDFAPPLLNKSILQCLIFYIVILEKFMKRIFLDQYGDCTSMNREEMTMSDCRF